MYRRTVLLGMAVLLGAGPACFAQGPASTPAKAATDSQTEAAQADELLQKQNFAGALPLYEDLHKQEPQNLKFQERLALSLIAGAAQQPPEQGKATLERARTLLLAAQAAGDNSNLLQILLEHLQPEPEGASAPAEPGQEWVDKGEKAFTSGDLAGAVEDYKKALQINPKLYAAALFAGDAEYKLGHPAQAGKWFAQAISIDPNTETAYRYWGDALERAGDHKQAEDEFIKAVVAEPYLRSPRIGLQQWANANHARLMAPPIRLPAGIQVADAAGNTTIASTVEPEGVQKTPETSVALAYSNHTALWREDKFHREFPGEHDYRHSLPEEAEGIRTMLAAAKDQKLPDGQLSTSVSLLQELDEKGMLECWILLDDADEGIARDYASFRQAHRALLERYIAEYEIHPN